jgi:hypothetical protein
MMKHAHRVILLFHAVIKPRIITIGAGILGLGIFCGDYKGRRMELGGIPNALALAHRQLQQIQP